MCFVVRRVLPLLAIAAITIAASCEPVKKAPIKDTPIKDTPPTGTSGDNIAYYFVEDGGILAGEFAFTRSSSPFEEDVCLASTRAAGGPGGHVGYGPLPPPVASQTLNDEGSVTLDVDFPDDGGGSCLPLSGFAVVVGPIADLATSLAGEQGHPVASFLAFDNDGDGEFGGDFAGDKTAGLGNDVVCHPGSGGGSPKVAIADPSTIDDTSEFQCFDEAASTGASLTLAQLKDGEMGLGEPFVEPTTPVAILVALASDIDATTTVDSLTINGVEQL